MKDKHGMSCFFSQNMASILTDMTSMEVIVLSQRFCTARFFFHNLSNNLQNLPLMTQTNYAPKNELALMEQVLVGFKKNYSPKNEFAPMKQGLVRFQK